VEPPFDGTADLGIVVDGIAYLCVRCSQKTGQQWRATS